MPVSVVFSNQNLRVNHQDVGCPNQRVIQSTNSPQALYKALSSSPKYQVLTPALLLLSIYKNWEVSADRLWSVSYEKYLLEAIFLEEAIGFRSWLSDKKFKTKTGIRKRVFYLKPHEHKKLNTFRKLIDIYFERNVALNPQKHNSHAVAYLVKNLRCEVAAQINSFKLFLLRQPIGHKHLPCNTLGLSRKYVLSLSKIWGLLLRLSTTSSTLEFVFRELRSRVRRCLSLHQNRVFSILLKGYFIRTTPSIKKVILLISPVLYNFFRKKTSLNKRKISELNRKIFIRGGEIRQDLKGNFYWEKKKKFDNNPNPLNTKSSCSYELRSGARGLPNNATFKSKDREYIFRDKTQKNKGIFAIDNTSESFRDDYNSSDFKVRDKRVYENIKFTGSAKEVSNKVKSKRARNLPRGVDMVNSFESSGNVSEFSVNAREYYRGLKTNGFIKEAVSGVKNKKKKGLFADAGIINEFKDSGAMTGFRSKTKYCHEVIGSSSSLERRGGEVKNKKKRGLFGGADIAYELKGGFKTKEPRGKSKDYCEDIKPSTFNKETSSGLKVKKKKGLFSNADVIGRGVDNIMAKKTKGKSEYHHKGAKSNKVAEELPSSGKNKGTGGTVKGKNPISKATKDK